MLEITKRGNHKWTIQRSWQHRAHFVVLVYIYNNYTVKLVASSITDSHWRVVINVVNDIFLLLVNNISYSFLLCGILKLEKTNCIPSMPFPGHNPFSYN